MRFRVWFLFILIWAGAEFFLSSQVLGESLKDHQTPLIEYGIGQYSNGNSFEPFLEPPSIKIYQNGEIIFVKNDKYYFGILPPNKLTKLKNVLEKEFSVQKSKFYSSQKGKEIKKYRGDFEHGGVYYLHYLDPRHQEVLLSTDLITLGSFFGRIVPFLETHLPSNASLYYPQEVEVDVHKHFEITSKTNPALPLWPFSEKIKLAACSSLTKISDFQICQYLFSQQYEAPYLNFAWAFSENGTKYSMRLRKVPGWFNDSDLKENLSEQKSQWLETTLLSRYR